MSWFRQCKAAVTKWGVGPAKFLLKTVLPAAVPGSGLVVDVAERVLSAIADAASEDPFPEIASGAELRAVGEILAEFEGRLADLVEQLLEREFESPDKLARLVVQEIKKDRDIEAALRAIAQLVSRFDRLEAQNRELLRAAHQGIDIQEVGLAVARRQETLVLDFIADQRAANVQLREMADNIAKLHAAIADLTTRPADALPRLRQLEAEQPKVAAVREAVAVGATFAFDLGLAASELERAVELRPGDKPLAELCRQVTIKTRAAGGDSSVLPIPAPSPAGPEFRPGDTLDGWKLLTLLGRGGFGQVFRAERGGKVRALKVLLPHLISDAHFEANFRREIVVLCGLGKLPYVVHYDDFNKDDATRCWYFTMEYVEGESLQTRLMKGLLSPAEAVALFTKLAGPGGLATVHEKGIVHRDIKPANILIQSNGTPKLVDFGVAVAARRGEKTKSGGHTVMFASPEQLRGFPAEKPSDVYSLVGSLWYAIMKQEPGLFRPKDLPAELDPLRKVLVGAFRHWPDERHPNAAAVFELLKNIDPTTLTRERTVALKSQAVAKHERVKLPALPPGRARQNAGAHLATLTGHTEHVRSVTFSPDGRLLATTSADRTAKLWSSPDGRCVATLAGHALAVSAVAFSPDGGLLATGSDDKTAKLWSVPEGRCVATLAGHNLKVRFVAFSPDGSLLATASEDTSAKLWSVRDGRCVATLGGHELAVCVVAFSPDGRLLATGSNDKTVRLWSVPEGRCVTTLVGHRDAVRAVAFAPDGRTLDSIADDKSALSWLIAESRCRLGYQAPSTGVTQVVLGPGGEPLAIARDNTTIKLMSLWGDGLNIAVLKGQGTGVVSVSFSPDGWLLATTSDDNAAKLWGLWTSEERPNWSLSRPRYSGRPRLHIEQSRNGIAYPGDLLWLQLGAENVGQGELVQVSASIESQDRALNRTYSSPISNRSRGDSPSGGSFEVYRYQLGRLAFGRIDPGQRLDRCLATVLPADTATGVLTVQVEFADANGAAPPTQELTWTVHPLPRPDFPTTVHLEAEFPGRPLERRAACRRKEIIDIVVGMTNRTGDDLPDVELVLTAVQVPQGVRITSDRWRIGTLNDDDSAEGRVGFTVDTTAQLGQATFEVRVISGDGRTFAILRVETAVE